MLDYLILESAGCLVAPQGIAIDRYHIDNAIDPTPSIRGATLVELIYDRRQTKNVLTRWILSEIIEKRVLECCIEDMRIVD